MLGPLEEAIEFVAGLANRLAHLGRDLGRDDLALTVKIIEPLPDDVDTFVQGGEPPAVEGFLRLTDLGFALGGAVERQYGNHLPVVRIGYAETHAFSPGRAIDYCARDG